MTHHSLLAQYCASIFIKIFQHTWLKTIFAGILVISTFLFDPNLGTEMSALMVLVIFDTMTAIIAAYKNNIPIESRKMLKSAVKTVIYFLLVSAGYVTEYVVPLHHIDQVVIGFLALTELVSIIENFGKAGYSVPVRLLSSLKRLKDEK